MVTDEALWAVTKNVVRHLVEANQHHGGARFASALASAVYAIEETGKLSFLTTHGESPKAKRHATHAMLFWALMKAATDWKWLWEWAQILQKGLTPNAVLTEQQRRTMADHPEYAEIIRRLQAGELSTLEERTQAFTQAMIAKDERDGTTEEWKPRFEKGLQNERLRATYVDVTESGFSSPETIQPEQASALCWLAFAMMTLIVATVAHTRPSLKEKFKTEVEGLFTADDLIGAADITRFIQAWQNAQVAPRGDASPAAESNAA